MPDGTESGANTPMTRTNKMRRYMSPDASERQRLREKCSVRLRSAGTCYHYLFAGRSAPRIRESGMIDPEEALSDVPDDVAVCGVCGGALPTTRYVDADADAWSVVVLCSPACLRAVLRGCRRVRWAARRRRAAQAAAVLILTGAFITPDEGPPSLRRMAHAAPPPQAPPPGPPPLPPGSYGPEWPPTEQSFLASLGQDAWIHPLSGPVRRMPRVDSRVFGAALPRERPAECRNGHCGVDLPRDLGRAGPRRARGRGGLRAAKRQPRLRRRVRSALAPGRHGCPRSTSIWPRSRPASSAACASRAATSSGCSATPA